MNILKAIKAWWKPEVKDPKIRVRFNSKGEIAMVYYPVSYDHIQRIMMIQELECYKIQIGQVKMLGGLGV